MVFRVPGRDSSMTSILLGAFGFHLGAFSYYFLAIRSVSLQLGALKGELQLGAFDLELGAFVLLPLGALKIRFLAIISLT